MLFELKNEKKYKIVVDGETVASGLDINVAAMKIKAMIGGAKNQILSLVIAEDKETEENA